MPTCLFVFEHLIDSMAKVAYTSEEKELLVQVLKGHPIIENKKSDATTIGKKQEAWKSVEKEYNACVAGEKRTVLQLKRCWDKLKRQRKEYNGVERRNIMATGGGPSGIATDKPTIDIEAVVPHITVEVENTVDSDAVYLKNETPMEMNEDITKPKSQTIRNRNNKDSINNLMAQRLENAIEERNATNELHKIKLAVEKTNLLIAEEQLRITKVDHEIAKVNLEIKKTELEKVKDDNENVKTKI